MNFSRALIGSLVFLIVGLTVIVGYCNGSISFHASAPVSGTTLQVNIVTNGIPALTGTMLTVIGLLLMAWAAIGAVAAQVHPPRTPADPS